MLDGNGSRTALTFVDDTLRIVEDNEAQLVVKMIRESTVFLEVQWRWEQLCSKVGWCQMLFG